MTVTSESVVVNKRKPLDRVACRAYLSADQLNLVDGTWTKVLIDTINYDLGGNFDIVTNNRFIVPVSGLYKVWSKVDFINISINKSYTGAIYVNGSAITYSSVHTGGGASEVDSVCTDEVYLNKDDYVELFARSNSGSDTTDMEGGSTHSYLGVRLISKEGIKQ